MLEILHAPYSLTHREKAMHVFLRDFWVLSSQLHEVPRHGLHHLLRDGAVEGAAVPQKGAEGRQPRISRQLRQSLLRRCGGAKEQGAGRAGGSRETVLSHGDTIYNYPFHQAHQMPVRDGEGLRARSPP